MQRHFICQCAGWTNWRLCRPVDNLALEGTVNSTSAGTPHHIGSRRELFIDDTLISKLTGGAQQRLHHPQPRELAIQHGEPWEGTGCGYHSLFQDDDCYRMYYKSYNLILQDGKGIQEDMTHRFTCYAESRDGINWIKPECNQVEFRGSRANNIVIESEKYGPLDLDAAHPAVFKDTNPNANPEGLYKAIIRLSHYTPDTKGLAVMQSADGIQWKPYSDGPVIREGAFDSQNLAFWDDDRGEYRAYWRTFALPKVEMHHSDQKGLRGISTATSPDLLNWSKPVEVTYTGPYNPEELYVNQIKPYHRAPHLLIGFPARYIERPQGDSMKALPNREHREKRSRSSERYGTAITDSLLMCSRDGVEFTRWPEAFLQPGPERSGTWNYGHQYLAWHIVETPSSYAPDGPAELSLYATENYWVGKKGSELRRYTLRLDGFVSIQAPMSGGECLTELISFDGCELHLNFATSAAGEIRIELQDESGTPLPGFSLEDSEPLFGDAVDRQVTWKGHPDLAQHAGKPVRLRFTLRDADLFAYRFAKP